MLLHFALNIDSARLKLDSGLVTVADLVRNFMILVSNPIHFVFHGFPGACCSSNYVDHLLALPCILILLS